MLKVIYFDWSGTLAKKGTKQQFIFGTNKLEQLFPDTIPTLQKLVAKGYILGIITNMSYSGYNFINALEESGLKRYFLGAIICSSDTMYRKPNPMIFEMAFRRDAVEPRETLMVGNKWETDIIGAETLGMQSFFKNNYTTLSDLLKFLQK
jgi:putative hydrolase of the HAD superfamily